ncbi:MAG: cation diffusion facilitator family transporter [Candidatus Heteroscillospira sp.]|jgi:cation diffusion facilitator family transporter
MINMLARHFIKDHENYTDGAVRRAYGMLCSVVGIVLNLLLFAGKYAAGVLSGSIAITADAFNNLSDGGSSLITLVGFRFSGMKPDKDHPFGHGRIEYISGFAVSVAIILMGFELGKSSVIKLFNPSPVEAGWLSMAILAVSIAVKMYMCVYNRSIGKKIRSEAMAATATDSLSDSVATGAVLLCMLIAKYTGFNLDAWCGVLVAVFILKAGYDAAKDTLSPLLGSAPDPELVQEIYKIVMEHEQVVGIHDLVVHDYGPGRLMISLHGEVPEDGDILEIHEAIDHIEKELTERLGCDAVIHMDPIATRDEAVNERREKVAELALQVDERCTIHDFRMVQGKHNTNIIFDLVLPIDSPMSEAEAKERITELVREKLPGCQAVVHIDKDYTER